MPPNNTPYSQQYGAGVGSLPVSGNFGTNGTFTLASFATSNAVWSVNLPRPGGFSVQFGVPGIDVPVPAAYNGGGVSEIAIFRPQTVSGGDADAYIVYSPVGEYVVSFTSPAVQKLGFTYQPGDIPAPADYDGVGHDEFAVYRPSTGQFFILNTPNTFDPSTWSLRKVTLNLPGGPNANDVPASEDYDGTGKADPTVYRPSNSTFYVIHSTTGLQQAVPFGNGNYIAPAGPLLYRLTALNKPGQATVTAGFTQGVGGLPKSSVKAASSLAVGGSIVSAAAYSPSSTVPVPTVVAVASPTAVVSTSTPTSTSISTPTPATVSVAPSAAAASISKVPVTVGAVTPTLNVPTLTPSKTSATVTTHGKAAKAHKPVKAHVVAKPHVAAKAHPAVETKTATPKVKETPAKPHVTASTTMKHVVAAKKGKARG